MVTKPNVRPAYKKTVPALLRKLRDDAGLTQRELGKRLKKGHAHVYKCEVGDRRVDVAEFIDWCVACGVDPRKTLDVLIEMRRPFAK